MDELRFGAGAFCLDILRPYQHLVLRRGCMEADASYVTGQKIFVLLVFLLHWKCELHDLEGWSAAYRILVTECCVS